MTFKCRSFFGMALLVLSPILGQAQPESETSRWDIVFSALGRAHGVKTLDQKILALLKKYQQPESMEIFLQKFVDRLTEANQSADRVLETIATHQELKVDGMPPLPPKSFNVSKKCLDESLGVVAALLNRETWPLQGL